MRGLTPNWPAPAHVRAWCSTREGGVSAAPYDSLNLGDHVADHSDAVARNRALYAEQLGAHPVYLKQVHGCEVLPLDAATPDAAVADACITSYKNLACTIMVADCLPVLFTNRSGTVVAAAHAGWRGLCGVGGHGVLEGTVEAILESNLPFAAVFIDKFAIKSRANELMAWMGPCIGSGAFEVGEEVREAFVKAQAQAAQHFKIHAPGKYLCDLQALARQRLAALGITEIYGNDGSRAWCTVSNPELFFSHRRDRVSGRFAASIWIA